MNIRKEIILVIMTVFISCEHEKKNTDQENTFENLKFLANQYYERDSHLEAVNYFSRLIKIDSTNGEYYYKRGYSYGQLEQYDMEEKDYLKSIAYNYRVADAYSNLAYFYIATHKDSLAIFYLHKYLELNPGDVTAQNALELYKSKESLGHM